VLRVKPGSPAAAAGEWALEDDVLTHAGSAYLGKEGSALGAALGGSLGKPLVLTVYRRSTKTERTVTVVPATGWGGSGCLGLDVQFQTAETYVSPVKSPQSPSRPPAYYAGMCVQSVKEGSPGDKAGKWALEDDVITHAGTVYLGKDAGALGAALLASLDKPLMLTVCRRSSRAVRTVTVVPTKGWGGDGLLGLDVAFLPLEGSAAPAAGSVAKQLMLSPAPKKEAAPAPAPAPASPVAAAPPPKCTEPGCKNHCIWQGKKQVWSTACPDHM
jgi:hypothetical protein